MKTFWIFLLVAGLPCLLLANYGGSVNHGTLGSGEFQAIGSSQISILKENLNIDLYQSYASVSVEYEMSNEGPEIEITAGFPGFEYNKKFEIEQYSIQDGTNPLPWTFRRGQTTPRIVLEDEEMEQSIPVYLSWLVSKNHFNASETKRIRISYISRYYYSYEIVSDCLSYSDSIMRYLLSTGATWKGPILKGQITIHPVSIDPSAVSIQTQLKFLNQAGSYTCVFSNLEPNVRDDIEIRIANNRVVVEGSYSIDDPSLKQGFVWTYIPQSQSWAYIDLVNYKIKASSTLTDSGGSYPAVNLKDKSFDTAWAEGVEGDGIGESLTLTLDQPMKLDAIGIVPGYAKSFSTYFNNNRIRQLSLIINDETTLQAELPDEYSFYKNDPAGIRYVSLGSYKNKIRTIRLVIDSVYPGTKYHDSCISEIHLQTRVKKSSVSPGR